MEEKKKKEFRNFDKVIIVRSNANYKHPQVVGSGYIVATNDGKILHYRGGICLDETTTELRQTLRGIILALNFVEDGETVALNLIPEIKNFIFQGQYKHVPDVKDLIDEYRKVIKDKNIKVFVDDKKRKYLRSVAEEISLDAKRKALEDREKLFDTNNAFSIYTDGSCDNLREPHYGGWAYLINEDGKIIEKKSGNDVRTTNNRMEMWAIISAISSLPNGSYARIFTDSEYCIGSFTRTPHEKLKNLDLIHQFISIREDKNLTLNFYHVQGHSDDYYNNIVDKMANDEFEKASGYEITDFKRLKTDAQYRKQVFSEYYNNKKQ